MKLKPTLTARDIRALETAKDFLRADAESVASDNDGSRKQEASDLNHAVTLIMQLIVSAMGDV